MSTPRLLPGVRLQRDVVREQWVIQAPERVIELDEIAHAVLQRVDGKRDVEAIVASLVEEYGADADEVRTDVLGLLDDLAGKRILLL
jgi:pyrroloquinoline quinone biosynthesis protein D